MTTVFSKIAGITLRYGSFWRPACAAAGMWCVWLVGRSLWRGGSALLDTVIGVAVLGLVYAAVLVALRGVPEDLSASAASMARSLAGAVRQLSGRDAGARRPPGRRR
jgi:hypothetical protein